MEAAYRKKLRAIVDEMHASVIWWLSAAYRQNEPRTIAEDTPPDASGLGGEPRPQSPAVALRAAMKKLARRWQARFNDLAPDLAAYFAKSAAQRSDAALRAALKKAGLTVDFRMTAAARDVLNATIAQNVSLIRSIPQKYLADVEQMVMRSVQTGRDLGQLADDLQEAYGVTKRRAALIALHQNNAATAAITRVRQVELGVDAEWRHSHAGRTPRPTHVAMNGKRYDPARGMYDKAEGRNVFPGELIHCRCVSRSVIAGF